MGQAWPASCNNVPDLYCLSTVFLNVTNAFLLFAGIVAIFLIVWSGVRLILSGGDAKQVTSARQTMTYAIVGLIVVLCSYSIVFFIGYLTKTTDCITDRDKITTGCQ